MNQPATPIATSRLKASRRPDRDRQRPQHQETQDQQQPGAAEEPELLPRHGEHEVGLLERDEPALGLTPLEQALPLPPAGTDRDTDLAGLVADPLRVSRGVGEG